MSESAIRPRSTKEGKPSSLTLPVSIQSGGLHGGRKRLLGARKRKTLRRSIKVLLLPSRTEATRRGKQLPHAAPASCEGSAYSATVHTTTLETVVSLQTAPIMLPTKPLGATVACRPGHSCHGGRAAARGQAGAQRQSACGRSTRAPPAGAVASLHDGKELLLKTKCVGRAGCTAAGAMRRGTACPSASARTGT